jgi:hypothetical protein
MLASHLPTAKEREKKGNPTARNKEDEPKEEEAGIFSNRSVMDNMKKRRQLQSKDQSRDTRDSGKRRRWRGR